MKKTLRTKKNPNILIYSLVGLIFLFTGLTVYSNYSEQQAIDESKIPLKVEESKGFQRWITNLKNKGVEIEADEFEFVEKNEIYNTKWMTVYSVDDPQDFALFEQTIAEYAQVADDIKEIEFSPSGRAVLDLRNEFRGEYKPNEVRYFGARDDKIFDARFLDCSERANCIFDRGYFIDNSNDVFFISEFSRNIPDEDEQEEDEVVVPCTKMDECTYTFKIHVVDMINNSRHIYESLPKDFVYDVIVPEL